MRDTKPKLSSCRTDMKSLLKYTRGLDLFPDSEIRMKFTSIFLSLLILMASPASMSQSAYKFVVSDAKRVSDDGTFSEWTYSIGKDFVLDRQTGRMSGAHTNHNANGQPNVIDYGSEDQAYKAVTIYEPFTALDYIFVQEFSGPAKPFIFLSGSITYSGLCTDY